MEGVLLFFHIVVCFLLVIVVLLQSGKSADLAGAFGGYGSQSTFGPRGTATLLSKLTTTLAILFMVTSLLLQVLTVGRSRSGSVLGKEKPAAKTETSQPLKSGSTVPQEQPKNEPGK